MYATFESTKTEEAKCVFEGAKAQFFIFFGKKVKRGKEPQDLRKLSHTKNQGTLPPVLSVAPLPPL